MVYYITYIYYSVFQAFKNQLARWVPRKIWNNLVFVLLPTNNIIRTKTTKTRRNRLLVINANAPMRVFYVDYATSTGCSLNIVFFP